MPFRYLVAPKTNVAAFLPKKVEGDMMNLRSTVLGGIFFLDSSGGKLPNSDVAATLWEVVLERSVPAEVVPKKPKCWLMCHTTLKAGHGHLLKVV